MGYEVDVLVSNIRYTDVTHIEGDLMNKCVVMTYPFLMEMYLERPCTQELKGRYLYVVLVSLNGGETTMGVNDLKVYSSRF